MNILGNIYVWYTALLIAVCADPRHILNRKEDPYANWVIKIAKFKQKYFFWKEYSK